MNPVAIGAVVLGVIAAATLLVDWVRSSLSDCAFDDLYPPPRSSEWPEPPWDAQSIRNTLAEIETL